VWLRKCTPRFVLRGSYLQVLLGSPFASSAGENFPPRFHLSSISFLQPKLNAREFTCYWLCELLT
jgi:hypothetical protein